MKDEQEETEFHAKKAATNIKKHGLSFEEAEEVFYDKWAIEKFDEKNSTLDDERFIVLGRIKSQLVVVVAYTPRNGKRRIITARKANSRERKAYYDRLGKI